MVHELPVLSRHPREKGRQEILLANKFVVPAQAGTQEQVTEIPRFPLSRERRGKGTRDECPDWVTASEAGVMDPPPRFVIGLELVANGPGLVRLNDRPRFRG